MVHHDNAQREYGNNTSHSYQPVYQDHLREKKRGDKEGRKKERGRKRKREREREDYSSMIYSCSFLFITPYLNK